MSSINFHPESLAYFKAVEDNNVKPYYELSVDDARKRSRASSELFGGSHDFGGTRDEIIVPSPHVEGGIPCYVYKPLNVGSDPPIILVYFHGGGLVVGSRMGVDTACKKVSDAGGIIVVNVEYRLAPEHKVPAAMDDAVCVTDWVLKNRAGVGGSVRSKVGVGGDSAGGSIAASVCHDVKGLAFQVLIYPHVYPRKCDLESFQAFAEVPPLTMKLYNWFQDLACNEGDYENIRAASINRKTFEHLPPCLFIVAEYDILRDESYEYQKKLTSAGVHSELLLVKGAIHAFFPLYGAFKELTEEPYKRTVEFIQRFGKA